MASAESDKKSTGSVSWMQDDKKDGSEIFMMTVEDASRLEHSLSNNPFMQGRTYDRDMNSALRTMSDHLGKEKYSRFDGVKLDTG